MIGLGLSIVQLAVRQLLGGAFTPDALFAANEQGAWYDPSDMSKLFQDAAGTTPVTAVEQPVGLMLDKSRGLVLGPELVTNGDFSAGTTGFAAIGSATLSVSGGAALVDVTGAAGGIASSGQSFNLTVGKSYRVSVLTGFATYNGSSLEIRIAGVGIASIQQGIGSCVFTATSTNPILSIQRVGTATGVFSVDNISVRELPGNHATQSTAASRPVLKQDENGKYYLLFDGIDDSLVTTTITPGTDKAQVFAGVRKLSSTALQVLFGLSDNNANNGAFELFAPYSSGDYQLRSKGSALAFVQAPGYTEPITSVVSVSSNISGDLITIRVNGTQAAPSTQDQGTGNFLAYPLYIGRRGGTSLPFNGRLYSLAVRFGPTLTTEQITQTETWVAGKTGVAL